MQSGLYQVLQAISQLIKCFVNSQIIINNGVNSLHNINNHYKKLEILYDLLSFGYLLPSKDVSSDGQYQGKRIVNSAY